MENKIETITQILNDAIEFHGHRGYLVEDPADLLRLQIEGLREFFSTGNWTPKAPIHRRLKASV